MGKNLSSFLERGGDLHLIYILFPTRKHFQRNKFTYHAVEKALPRFYSRRLISSGISVLEGFKPSLLTIKTKHTPL